MGDSRSGRVLWHLHRWLGSPASPADDGGLLERFVLQRDEGAFAELVSRHGPLVFGLCRRLLGNVQDAEDVFQATFLVLAHKAATIRKPESLSCFLHGVAYRLALKARAGAKKRRIHERQAAPPDDGAETDLSWREVRGLLDEELQRLPEKQRLPLVLCYLEGLTQDEASRRLGWPRGTLKRRLETGRERLRIRLTHRGVTLGAGLFAAALTESATRGAVSSALGSATVRAAIQFSTYETAAIAATPAVMLAKGALQTMFMTKLKIASVVLLLLACAGFGASQLAQHRSTPQATAADKKAEKPKASADKVKAADEVQADLAALRGTWISEAVTETVIENGKPQPPRQRKDTYVISDDKLIQLGEDGMIDEEWTIRLDPTRKPKTIDLISYRLGTLWGIYRLEGDSLKIRYSDEKEKRPAKISSEKESDWALWNLTRTSRAPKKAVQRFPNAPGWFWMIEPGKGGLPNLMATIGIVYIFEKGYDGAAYLTLAATLPDRRQPEFRPVFLDATGKRYLPTSFGPSGSSGLHNGPIVALNRWRMDPKELPPAKVARIGIEGVIPKQDRKDRDR
jgi:RNA polymerase sigma factor (sigma-70 family)